MGRPKKTETESNSETKPSVIDKEVKKYEKQIEEIQKACEDVNLKEVFEPKDKLDLTLKKISILEKLPKLLLSLKELKEESAKEVGSVRGQQELSELEKGEI